MRFVQIIILSLFFCFGCLAQETVKQHAVPKRKTKSVKKLALALTKDSCGEYDKAKRIYDWITENIKYDVWRYDHFKWKETTPEQTLRRRKAICSGYSLLFQALCKEAGIHAWVVEGYDKTPHYKNNAPYFFEEHAWNVFQADGTYHIVDATWGSGGISRKAKMIVLFNHPFYFIRSKFVRRYNQDYFDADTSWFLQTHLPLLPMWQLKTNVLTVERFEKQHFIPDSSSSAIEYKNEIQSYHSRTKEDNWLYEGSKGHIFFNRNNRTKGYHSYKFLVYSYKKYDLGNPKVTDKSRKKIAASLADTVVCYTRLFIKDNKVRHKYVLDSIANRHRTILPFTSRLYKEDLKKFRSIKGKIRGLENQINSHDESIRRRHNGFSRLTGDDIEDIKLSYVKAHPDTLALVIARLQSLYDKNTQKIDSLNARRMFWYDSIQFKMPELDVVHDSIAAVYGEEIENIKINTVLNSRLAPLFIIRQRQNKIMELRSIHKKLEEDYVAIQRYIFTNYLVKQIDPINRTCIGLLKRNKSLLKRMAKLNGDNAAEKKSYRIENKKLYNQLSQTTKKSQIRITLLEKNIDWLRKYKKILKVELKCLGRDIYWQNGINKYATKHAHALNKFYYHYADHVVKSSLGMKSTLRVK